MSSRQVAVELTDEQLVRLADLIADKLATRSDGELITASELADRIGRSREFIYEHAQQLGVIRLGDGERPRLMFRWPQVLGKLDSTSAAPKPAQRTPTRRRTKQVHGDLLPIRGQST